MQVTKDVGMGIRAGFKTWVNSMARSPKQGITGPTKMTQVLQKFRKMKDIQLFSYQHTEWQCQRQLQQQHQWLMLVYGNA